MSFSSRFAANRKGTSSNPRANQSTVCQKCLGTGMYAFIIPCMAQVSRSPLCGSIGHFIYECKNSRPYSTRPSRTQQLEKPDLHAKRAQPSVELPDEFRSKYALLYSLFRSNFTNGFGRKGLADKILTGKETEREQEKKRIKR